MAQMKEIFVIIITVFLFYNASTLRQQKKKKKDVFAAVMHLSYQRKRAKCGLAAHLASALHLTVVVCDTLWRCNEERVLGTRSFNLVDGGCVPACRVYDG